MKNIMLLCVLTLVAYTSKAQFWNHIDNRIENKVNNRIDRGIDNNIDKALDKSEESVKEGAKGNKGSSNKAESTSESNSKTSSTKSNTDNNNNIQAYSKFDFVPGEKIIAYEDFSSDAIGDFPINWNTNSGAELVSLSGQQGKWLMLTGKGVFVPELFNSLPDNFTFEFNLACSQPFSFYSSELNLCFVDMPKPSTDFTKWQKFSHGKDGVCLGFHPQDAGSGPNGQIGYEIYKDDTKLMENNTSNKQFNAKQNPVVKISIWRQKGRLRVYIDEEKIWDLPKAFASTKYNGILFWVGDYSPPSDKYYISNLKLAVGAPDTRNKLITEGKFTTRGILFDVNSDKIKPESYGAIKDIATVLTENPDVRVKIIGHTDSDGDDTKNLELSKKRADAVRVFLNKEFGIASSRMEIDGKGESQPVDNNTSAEGKANNRRVEFIKL